MKLEALLASLVQMEGLAAGVKAELEKAIAGRDLFAMHVAQSRREYRDADEAMKKSPREVERVWRDTFLKAQKLGFHGTFAAWREVLKAGVSSRA